MKITKSEIQAVSKPEGYSGEKAEQVLGMLRVLQRVQADDALRGRLALKGGSAINFFLLDKIARLSVDLDFDYIAPRETLREALSAAAEHKGIFDRIARELRVQVGEYVPPRKDKRIATIKFVFDSSISGQVIVSCDISYFQRQTIFGEQERTFIGFGKGIDLFKDLSALVISPADVWGSKLVALVWMAERDLFPREFATPDDVRFRHLFDAWQLRRLRHKGKVSRVDFERIKTAFIVWGPPRDYRFPYRRGEVINKIEFEDIETNLYSFLPASLRPGFDEMRSDILDDILTPIYQKDEGEKAYVREFMKGKYIPEFIFGEMDYYLLGRMRECSYLRETARMLLKRRKASRRAKK